MKASSEGRRAHTEAEIRAAGFEPSNEKLTEGPRNFVPEAIEDSVGNTHLLIIKNSGYYTASFSNNVYPAIINAGRRGVWCKKSIRGGCVVLMWVLGLIFRAKLGGFGLLCLKSGVRDWGIAA